MLFRIDPSGTEPLAAQLASQIRSAAARGELTPGTRLPSARDVADSLGVNLHTVLRAYQDVRDEGLIDILPGCFQLVDIGGEVIARGKLDDDKGYDRGDKQQTNG